MKRSTFITSFVFLAFCVLSPLFASTNVSTDISSDTNWDRSGSPYLVQGKVTVAKGATLSVGPSVQVIFQSGAILEIDGTLRVNATAAGPAAFNLTDGGMQSQLFVNQGSAFIYDTKILGGVLLARDAKFRLEGSEVTKGSGVYLQGSTLAYLNNNKIYGNATGIVLDGKVKLYGQFNTLVGNTYGFYLKGYSFLKFKNNSIHDNQKEVVNKTPSFNLGNNYWGTTDSGSIHAKIEGAVDLTPVKTLKDVLRVYVRTQLPAITPKMATALAAKEKREAAEDALALEKFKKMKQEVVEVQGATPSSSGQAPPPVPGSATGQAAPSPGATAQPSFGSEAAAPPMPSGEMAPPSLPGMENMPPTASTAGSTMGPGQAAPPVPGTIEAPPALPGENPAIAANPAPGTAAPGVPVPPEVSGSTSGQGLAANQPSAPPAGNLTPPDIETASTPPTTSAPPMPPAGGGNELIPPPPDLNEQMAPSAVPPVPQTPALVEQNNGTMNAPPAPPVSTAQAPPPMTSPAETNPLVPPVPAVSSASNPVVQNQPIPTPIPPAEETQDQAKTLKALQGVNGDIDGMQAPPLEVTPDLSNPSSTAESPAPKAKTKGTSSNDLDLPPLKDADVVPPKDLDLPPTDDLGNINLNSPSK